MAKVLKDELKIAFSSVLFCESPGHIRYRFTDQLLRVAIRLKVVRGSGQPVAEMQLATRVGDAALP